MQFRGKIFCIRLEPIRQFFALFLQIVLYAVQGIKEIIDQIKANDKIKWRDTIIVITSDNGAAPGRGPMGPLFGSALPFRGRKSYFCI